MKKEEKQKDTDSNPNLTIRIHHEEHEEKTKGRIRIPYTAIRILISGVLMNKARQFESSRYGFESLDKNKSRRLKVRESDSNPSWRKIQISLRRFEFPTQRFESLMAQNSNLTHAIRIPYTAIRIPHGVEFKFGSGDSNPWFCRSIKCATCNSSYPIFKSNLSHNG